MSSVYTGNACVAVSYNYKNSTLIFNCDYYFNCLLLLFTVTRQQTFEMWSFTVATEVTALQ